MNKIIQMLRSDSYAGQHPAFDLEVLYDTFD